jgi:putative ABC transport system permease protein
MRVKKTMSMALDALRQRKLRTTLTTLGVVIGITMIIALASLGEGFRYEVKHRMEAGFELNVLIVFPGSVAAGFGQPFSPTDVARIRNITNVNLVTPMITLPSAKVNKSDGGQIGAFTVGAVNFTEMQQMLPERFRIAWGSFPSSEDNDTIVLGYKAGTRNGTAVVSIGENVSLTMKVETRNPLTNATIEYTLNKTLRVAGLLHEGGTPGITNFDYWAFIPMNTAVQILGEEYYQIILVQVSDLEISEQTAKDVEDTFENPYAISVLVPSTFTRQVDNILNLLQIFLMAVASISLLVAGIGIMNIMTVSVMERTREVGILKAIGARSRTVLILFLAEAILIGAVGGMIGLLTGYGLSHVLAYMLSSFIRSQQQDGTLFQTPERQALQINPIFTPEWTIAAFIFAIVICVVFGLYPARKASKMNPVEALRYE